MAECHGDIVYRKDKNVSCSTLVADDNAALVKAYETAVKSLQKGSTSEGEESADGLGEKPQSGERREGAEKERTATWRRWAVGSRCRVVWSGDGLLYPATLVSVEGERGTVKFDGYGNEEEVELSVLQPERLHQPWREKQWVLGSRCRAVWSEDGLVYPAVLVWKKADRGRVQFEGYGNEEELELSALLPPEECRSRTESANSAKVQLTGQAGTKYNSNNTNWRKNEKENESKKGDSAIILPPTCSTGANGERGTCPSDLGEEQKAQVNLGSCREKQTGPLPSSTPPFDFCPPVPPRIFAQNILPSTPPPPPPPLPGVWSPCGGVGEGCEGSDQDVSALSSMLLSWYLCGYHTGCYMALQQAKASRKRADKKTHKPDCTYEKSKH